MAAGLLAASGSMFFASTALAAGAAGGNNGTVKLGSANQPFTNANDPHLTCPIQIQWDGFDPGTQTFTVTAATQAPTGGTVTITGNGTNGVSATFNAQPWVEQYSLTFGGGATPNNKGEYHVGLTITTTSSIGTSDVKSKTIWVTSCAAPPAGTVTLAGACNHASGNYEWTLTAANPAAAVSGNYTPSGGAATGYTTSAAGSFSFNTAHNPGPVSFTVTTAGYTAANSPQTATTDHACDAPLVVDPTAQASANCNTLSAHLVAGTSDTTFDINHNGVIDHVTVTKNTTQDVSYNNSGAGANITVKVGASQKATATASNSCGGNPTPATANANADCSALTAHLDGGTNGATFTVTEPGGTHQVVVPAGGTDNVSYGSGNGAVITVSDGATVLDTASAPTDCTSPGQADPEVSGVNHCKTGINLTLSNMNGTAPTAFTVTDPDGNTQVVGVRAGQLKKLAFAVEEDTTGTVTVAAPGLAKQTFTYEKNCATVLGVKHTRKPTHEPVPVVEGEHSELPFTGFNTRRALLDGAALFCLGAVLCILGSRRRDEEIAY